jgi:hypothetical protein
MDAYNRRGQADMGGLSPVQVQRLLSSGWEGEGGAVRLTEDLGLPELAGARILHNARAFLAALREEDGTRATSAGNLNRKFVQAMVERLAWRPGFVEDLRRWNKVVNEEDAWPLHRLRLLLDLAGLVTRRKGRFRATRRSELVTADDRAGALFALLFRSHFRTLNLAYLDGAPEAPGFQETIAYTLYRFGVVGDAWRSPEELAAGLLLPTLRERLEEEPPPDPAPLILRTRLLGPLEDFGLADLREEPGEQRWETRRFYRKTALFDRFLRFEL